MRFCSNLIKMSLCDAVLKKPRIDTTEDLLRCPLLSGAGPQGDPVSVAGQATEDRRQELCGQCCHCFKQRETASVPQ